MGDLAYLNDYELAALVAEQPVPVWVGIGHERDKVVLDEVAHTSFDTPSKVIAAIRDHLAQLVAQLLSYQAQIKQAASRQLQTASEQSTRQLNRVQTQTIGQLTALRKDCDFAWQSIQQNAQWHIGQATRLATESRELIKSAAYRQVDKAHRNSVDYQHSILKGVQQHVIQAQRDSQYLRDIVLLQQPARVLKQGYTMIRDTDSNQTLTSRYQLSPNQNITIILKDGQATACISHVEKSTMTTIPSNKLLNE